VGLLRRAGPCDVQTVPRRRELLVRYFDDSSVGSYDPARECCVVIANDPANAADAAGAGDGEVRLALGTGPRLAAGPSAPPPSPLRGGDINAQLAQPRELQAKLAEEYRTVRLLRASIAGVS
jgi:hypothetical protein